MRCLQPPLDRVPDDEWFCPLCAMTSEFVGSCSAALDEASDALLYEWFFASLRDDADSEEFNAIQQPHVSFDIVSALHRLGLKDLVKSNMAQEVNNSAQEANETDCIIQVEKPAKAKTKDKILDWPSMQREEKLCEEEFHGRLKFELVRTEVDCGVLLLAQIGLKELFNTQLPQMTETHIAKVLFDENSRSLVALRDGRCIGGLTYKYHEFPANFLELIFFAVAHRHKAQGVGARMMNR